MIPPALSTAAFALLGGVIGASAASALTGEKPSDSPLVGLGVFLGLIGGAAVGIAATKPPTRT